MTPTELVLIMDKYFKELDKKLQTKEWLNLKEGAFYAGVSYNKFLQFRHMGLEFVEIDRIKKVSKTAIDEFYKNNSF